MGWCEAEFLCLLCGFLTVGYATLGFYVLGGVLSWLVLCLIVGGRFWVDVICKGWWFSGF